MYKFCKTEQSFRRQRQLELGLLAAMRHQQYDQITVSDLCQWMGIPRKSFYRYFSGKDGALHALIDHTIMEYNEGSNWMPVSQSNTRNELVQFFRFWQEQKELMDALQRSELSGILIERGVRYALSSTIQQKMENHGPVLNEEEQMAVFISCGLISLIVQWHHGGYAMPAEQMAEIAFRILTQPLME